MKHIKLTKSSALYGLAVAGIGIGLIGIGVIAEARYGSFRPAQTTQVGRMGNGAGGIHDIGTEPSLVSDDQLLFLIEEEKMAHDVYVTLGDKWGARVFTNIARSETTHQERVLELLNDRGIDDPRSDKVGVFKNADLQKLYDKLVADGLQSATKAYEAGKLVEETDIADIDKMLKNESDSAVAAVLTALRKASENHLRAFNRQLDRG